MTQSPIDVQRHLKGADYPATGEQLAQLAEQNGAAGDLVEKLRAMGDQRFDGPDNVMGALGGSLGGGS